MSRYFNSLSTSTLRKMEVGWERELDRTASGDTGTLPFDYLADKLHIIRAILEHREYEKAPKSTKRKPFKSYRK